VAISRRCAGAVDRLRFARKLVALLTFAVGLGAAAPVGAQTPTTVNPVGNVTPTVQPTTGVAAVAQSAPVDGQVAVLVRNASTKPVRIDRVTAVATSADGSVVIGARTTKAYPQVVAPTQLALASVRFRGKDLAANPNPTITVKVRSTRVSAVRAGRLLSVGSLVLSPPQTGAVAQTMAATLTNPTKAWTARRPEVAVMCFSEASTPTTFTNARAPVRRLAPAKSASVSVPLTSLCPTYLVAARAS
jgi:hypothetical protein